MNNWLFILPFLSALLGWCIHRIALGMLFNSKAISRYQQQLAAQLGRLAQAEWLAFDLDRRITDPARLECVMPLIEEHMDDFLRHRLQLKMPMLGMLIGDKTIQTLKTIFMEEIGTLFPQLMHRFAGNLAADPDVEKIVREKIAAFPSDNLRVILAKPLQHAALAGALTGFLLGGIQIAITLLVG